MPATRSFWPLMRGVMRKNKWAWELRSSKKLSCCHFRRNNWNMKWMFLLLMCLLNLYVGSVMICITQKANNMCATHNKSLVRTQTTLCLVSRKAERNTYIWPFAAVQIMEIYALWMAALRLEAEPHNLGLRIAANGQRLTTATQRVENHHL